MQITDFPLIFMKYLSSQQDLSYDALVRTNWCDSNKEEMRKSKMCFFSNQKLKII